MRAGEGRVPGSRSIAGNPGHQGWPCQPNRYGSAVFASRSSSCGRVSLARCGMRRTLRKGG
jgi:hypothetical protein